MMDDLNKRVFSLEKDVEILQHEQVEMKKTISSINDLASSVKVMVNEMKHMNEKIDDINSKVELHHTEEPNKLMGKAKETIVIGIVSAIVGAIIALVLK